MIDVVDYRAGNAPSVIYALERLGLPCRLVAKPEDVAAAERLILPGVGAARATLESALARRETRGAHNRSDYPRLDPALRVNMVWSLTEGLTQEPVPETPEEIARLTTNTDDSVVGKLVE